MKIKTRLKINNLISLSIVIFITLLLAWSFQEARRADQNVLLVHEIDKASLERIVLRDDWLLFYGSRARIQWLEKTEDLGNLLESATRRLTSKEAQDILQDIRDDYRITTELFTDILEKYKGDNLIVNNKFVFTEAETIKISQIFLKAYSLKDNISLLHEHSRKAAIAARERTFYLVIFFIIGGITMLIANSIVTNTILTKRLIGLNKGLEMISSNPDYHIDDAGDDELADLARASNVMVNNLKKSYVSISDLEREISERKMAEEKVKSVTLHQKSLFAAIPDIVMEVDNNKIYTWANDPGIKFFGEDVIGKEADSFFVKEQNTYNIVRPVFNGSEDVIYVESWQKRKDGQERLLAWRCHALKDTQGNVTGALSSARDITESKLVEDEIRKLNEELEQRVAQRTAELSSKAAELGRINNVFVDRELRMRELKERIAELKARIAELEGKQDVKSEE